MGTGFTNKMELLLPGVFAAACLLFSLFFPFLTILETLIGVATFLMLLPLLFVRIILREDGVNPFRFFAWQWNLKTGLRVLALFVIGIVMAFGFAQISVLDLYRTDLEIVGMTNFLPTLIVNILYFAPFFFIFTYFTFGFIPYLFGTLPAKVVFLIGVMIFLLLISAVYAYSFPSVPLWFLLPIAVPLAGVSFFRKQNMLWLVPALMSVINIIYALIV